MEDNIESAADIDHIFLSYKMFTMSCDLEL